MKRLLAIFILITGGPCFSQTHNVRDALLEIGYGVSVPFGKFENAVVTDSASGYATAGTNLNVFFTYLVNKKLGVAAMVSSSVNRLFTTGVKNRYQTYADKIEGVVSDMHLGKWNTMAYMAGGYFTYPLGKASFNLQLLAGYSRTEYPEVNVIIYSKLDSNAVEVGQSASDVASAFCFNAGAGLKYNISEIMCLSVNANFLSAYPKFESVVTTSSFQSSTPDEVHKVHQRVSLLNATVGVGFRF
jgi:hypothetical protein